MKAPLPVSITHRIAVRATVLAKAAAPRSKWTTVHGADALYPRYEEGRVGVSIPNAYKYMRYQDRGTKGHLQTELIGKTIPIRGIDGTIHFRKVKAESVGKTVPTRDENGVQTGTHISWYHPGIKAKHFISNSIQQAAKEWRAGVTKRELLSIVKDAKGLEEIRKFLS